MIWCNTGYLSGLWRHVFKRDRWELSVFAKSLILLPHTMFQSQEGEKLLGQLIGRCSMTVQFLDYFKGKWRTWYRFISLVGRVFARVHSLVESYQRHKKWYLVPPCLILSILRYGSRVKWSNPGEGVAPSSTSWWSSYWKGSLQVTLDYSRQLYLLFWGLYHENKRKKNGYRIIYKSWILSTAD